MFINTNLLHQKITIRGVIMGIIGFNFIQINAKKSKPITGKINISNNVALKNVEPMKLPENLNTQKGVKFIFTFTSKYEPSIGTIQLDGEVLYFEKTEAIDAILKEWQSTKKVKAEVMESIMNHILMKCNIQSLIIAKDMNLPPQIQLPKVTRQSAKAAAGKKK